MDVFLQYCITTFNTTMKILCQKSYNLYTCYVTLCNLLGYFTVPQWLSASPLGSWQRCTFLDVSIWLSFLIQLSITWVWDETPMCFAGGPPGATFISFLQEFSIWLHREYSHVYKEVTVYCSSCTRHIIAKLNRCN